MYKKSKSNRRTRKTGLINKMTKISNTLLKQNRHKKIVFKQILDNFGGHLRVVLYGAAPNEQSNNNRDITT